MPLYLREEFILVNNRKRIGKQINDNFHTGWTPHESDYESLPKAMSHSTIRRVRVMQYIGHWITYKYT